MNCWTCPYLDSHVACHLCLCAQVEITNLETLVHYVVQAPNVSPPEEDEPSPDDLRRAYLQAVSRKDNPFNIPPAPDIFDDEDQPQSPSPEGPTI
jgi:hypothetical protein